MADWRLSQDIQSSGLLVDTDKFLGSSNLQSCKIHIPTSMDIPKAVQSLSGIVSVGIRSFEIWWDSEIQLLDVVIVASKPDLDKFKQSMINAYPNIDFEDMDYTVPKWFKKSNNHKIFDVGYQHGHFFAIFDKTKEHQIISQIANTIQLSNHAWIQFVFKSHSFVGDFNKHITKIA